MLRSMGSPVRPDFIQWLLTFHAWLPGWPPSLVLKFQYSDTFVFPDEADEIVFISPFGYFIYLLGNSK